MKRKLSNVTSKLSASSLPVLAVAVAMAMSVGGAVAGKADKGWMQESEMQKVLTLAPDKQNGMEVYEVCAACHLTEGWGTKEGTFPQLAGQHRSVLIKQLADIRALNRDNPSMYPFALPAAIGDEQALADVTTYIEKLPMNPEWGKGEWGPGTVQYMLGEQLYKKNCVECHGETGMGDPVKYYPRINGQHYNYMMRQFEWIRDGKRRNANPEMVKQIENFSDDDMKFVINYVTHQAVPKEDLAPSAD